MEVLFRFYTKKNGTHFTKNLSVCKAAFLDNSQKGVSILAEKRALKLSVNRHG